MRAVPVCERWEPESFHQSWWAADPSYSFVPCHLHYRDPQWWAIVLLASQPHPKAPSHICPQACMQKLLPLDLRCDLPCLQIQDLNQDMPKLPLFLRYILSCVSCYVSANVKLWCGHVKLVASTSLVWLIILSVDTFAWGQQSGKTMAGPEYKHHLPGVELTVLAVWLASRHAHIRVLSVYDCKWSLPWLLLSNPMLDDCGYTVFIVLKRSSAAHVSQIDHFDVRFRLLEITVENSKNNGLEAHILKRIHDPDECGWCLCKA